jgi:uncharacterized integral membrane protein
MKYKLIIGLIFLVPVLSFVLQNDQNIELVLFKWHFSAPLALVIFSAALIGIILGILAGPSRKLRKARLEKRAQKEQHKADRKPTNDVARETRVETPAVAEPTPQSESVVSVEKERSERPEGSYSTMDEHR